MHRGNDKKIGPDKTVTDYTLDQGRLMVCGGPYAKKYVGAPLYFEKKYFHKNEYSLIDKNQWRFSPVTKFPNIAYCA